MALATTDDAFDVTGCYRGAITPFGLRRMLSVFCDASAVVSIGGKVHSVAIHLDCDDLTAAIDARIADATKESKERSVDAMTDRA